MTQQEDLIDAITIRQSKVYRDLATEYLKKPILHPYDWIADDVPDDIFNLFILDNELIRAHRKWNEWEYI